MRVIIAGPRYWPGTDKEYDDYQAICDSVKESGFTVTEVVSGRAVGVDRLGERWAEENGIPIKTFKPDWKKYPKVAGFVRNGEMARYADALVAIDVGSNGTANMIEQARHNNIKVFVFPGARSDAD